MLFKDVIGLNEVKLQLLDMVHLNRLSHALLFLSNEGSGALPLALAFAQYVCLRPSSPPTGGLFEPEPLPLPATPDEADAYMQAQAGFSKAHQYIHPDIHFSYPVVTSDEFKKPICTDYIAEWREFIKFNPYGNVYDWLQNITNENKQGNITADECNDILRKLSLQSFESEYKVIVLWMPEYLNKEGNKLLKIIEEPPPDTLFILVAENENLILPTILSRTQLIKIPVPGQSAIAEALVQRAKLSPTQAEQIASVCEGNYREALQLIQHAEEDWQSLLREWLNTILKTGAAAQVKWIDEINKLGREKQKQLLRYFVHMLQQALHVRVASLTPHAEEVYPMAESERDFAARLNKISSIAQQEEIIRQLDNAIYFIERNANAKILFHALTIKLYHIIQNKMLVTCW